MMLKEITKEELKYFLDLFNKDKILGLDESTIDFFLSFYDMM
jgi:hypothetical protein